MFFYNGTATEIKNKKELFWFTIGCTFLFGLLAHGYSYFNIMYSHDSLVIYQGARETAIQVSVGRFMAPLYIWLRGMFYTPSLVAVLSLLYLGVAIYYMMQMFNVKKKIFVVLTCGILATCTANTLLHTTYMHDIDRYMCSFLLSVLAVILMRRYRYGLVFGAVLICVSLGLYQSYFQVAILLVMMLATMDILSGKDTKYILLFGLKGLATLGIGVLLYYIIAQIVPVFFDITLEDNYNSLNNVGGYGDISNMLMLIGGAYRYVFDYFLNPVTAHSNFAAFLNVLICLLLIGMIIYVAKKRRISIVNAFLLAILLVLMPFGMNIIYFISHGLEHNLMIFSFFLLYFFFLLVFEQTISCISKKEKNLFREKGAYFSYCIVICVFSWMILNNTIYANQMYLQKELEYQNTLLTINRIIDRMEQTDGYVLGDTPVALVGTLQHSLLSVERPEYFDKKSVGNSQNFAVTYYETYENYFKRFLNYPIILLDEEESMMWAKQTDVQNMPSFPDMESCKMINGTLVVKLSE